MPTKTFSISVDEPPNLTVTWIGFWKKAKVQWGGETLLEFENNQDIKKGREAVLPDGRTLFVQLSINSVTSAFGPQIKMLIDGKPVPGTATDPKTRIDGATAIVFVVAGFSIVFGLIAWFGNVQTLQAMGMGWPSVLFGAVMGALGLYTKKRSMVALGIAMALLGIDTIGMLLIAIEQVRFPVMGLVFRIIFLVAMAEGLSALFKLKQEDQLELEKKLWTEPLGIATGILSGALIILSLVGLSMTEPVAEAPDPVDEFDLALAREFEALEKNLPVMVDSDTRLDRVSIRGSNIYYEYSMINHALADLDRKQFESGMATQLKTTECKNSGVTVMLDHGKTLHFHYFDKNDREIAQFAISKSDCE